MQNITFRASEHPTAHDAIVETNFTADLAISIGRRFFAVTDLEYRRLQNLGIQPTTWHHHEATGLIMSVPGKS